MSISGNVQTMPFADLLQWVSQSRKTGTLVVEGKPHVKKLYFSDGLIVAVASNNPKEFLGYYLVGWGFVGEEELQELLDMQEQHGTMLGELLVMIGRVSREDLSMVLQIKTEESLYDLFLWNEGEFKFLEKILPEKKFKPLDMPVDMIIMEGVRRKDEWSKYCLIIPDGTYRPKVAKPIDIAQMGPDELVIIREINGSNSIDEIALACRLPQFSIVDYVYAGATQDLFEVLPPAQGESAIPGFSKDMWRTMIVEARRNLELGNLLAAYRYICNARQKFPDRKEVVEQTDELEISILDLLSAPCLDDSVVLELAVSLADLADQPFSPEEGFLISRINGVYKLGDILIMVPGSDIDKRLIVDNLLKREVVREKVVAPVKDGLANVDAGDEH